MVGTNHGRYYDESSCVEESVRADKEEVAARKQPNNNIGTFHIERTVALFGLFFRGK